MQKKLSDNEKSSIDEERKITNREFSRIFPLATIMVIIMVIIQYIISSIFIKGYWPPLLPYIVMAIIVSLFAYITMPAYPFLNKMIKEKVQYKYGISDFTLGAIIVTFFVMLAVFIYASLHPDEPLNIAQVIFLILFGILIMFIAKYVFKSK